MAERLHAVTNLFKLLDTCNQCALAFRMAAESESDPVFLDYFNKLQTTLVRFVYELQTEMRRTDDATFGAPRSYAATGDPDFLRSDAEASLETAVERYEEVLSGRMPPHARAMLRRQCGALHEFLNDLGSVRGKLSA